jgi:RecT family
MSTEISTHRASTGLALQSFDDAFRFAKMVAGSEFAPKDFKGKPESCMLAIQHGSEVGLSPMQSLQSIAVINGRPCVWGDAAIALVKASPVCEFVWETVEGDGDQMVAMCQAKRRGYEKATTVTFSVADAKKAGLWGKTGPWQQYPKRMLQLRARGFALRDAFPDVLRGLITAEEAQDYPQPVVASEPIVVRPKFDDAEPRPSRIVLSPKVKTEPQRTRAEAGRLAISAAKTIEACESLRLKLDTYHDASEITDEEFSELTKLLMGKVEILMSTEEVTA